MNMKKLLKSLLAIAAAFLMVFSLGTTVYATTSVTINDGSGSDTATYKGWRIFDVVTGTDNDNKTTYNYTVNSDYSSQLVDKTVVESLGMTYKSTVTADEVLNTLEGNGIDSEGKSITLTDEKKNAFAKALYSKVKDLNPDVTFKSKEKKDNVTDGYYLIAENVAQNASTTADGDTVSLILLKTADATDNPDGLIVSTKEGTPTVDKYVKEHNDSTQATDTYSDWQYAADYDIGDYVPFKLVGTLSDKYANYDTYYYEFSDKLDPGFTYDDKANLTVELYDSDGETKKGTFTISGDNTNNFTITPGEYSKSSGTTLSVKTTDLKLATVKDSEGNAVSVDANDKIVVTYKAKLNSNAIIGSAGNWNKVTLKYESNPNVNHGGTSTQKPTQEKTVVVFTYKTIVNKVDAKGNDLTGATFTLYKIGTNNEELALNSEVIKGGADPKFTFEGLDAGKYVLKETKQPDGFTKANDIYFEIKAELDQNNKSISSFSGNITSGDSSVYPESASASLNDGTYSFKVINTTKGALPTTGGIGTTMFYVIGGSLVAVAAVLLITKKRATE